MSNFIDIGYGNKIATSKIVAIVTPEAAPIKRAVQDAKEASKIIDATCGRKTRAVIFTDAHYIVLSALLPETLSHRVC